MDSDNILHEYIHTSKRIIELRNDLEVLKIELKCYKIRLRDDEKYAHLKSKTAKDEQITLDTYQYKEDQINLETKIEYLKLKQDLLYLQVKGIISPDIVFDDCCNIPQVNDDD